ncbi:CCA tRNA nucleotidyltransferase [Liquorilactobacillus sicerae]|uniref:CCA tRNA nucleotidyltransferase n=1 Tax=Liquorilactobacillus sicerae TaxID=1416943 RepID=UPI002480B80D|nr:CCA tRNA nucleotidyltransferase [Liquorilactobacillus sicerae]
MIVEKLPIIFQQALPILTKIQAAGFEAYFVGGSVRDLLLGKQPHDVDIATSAYPAEIKSIFSRTVDTGIKHGTVTVLAKSAAYEITTFRTESGYQDFRRPDQVTFVRSLQDDLKRRDLTINALAMDSAGQVIDLFNGLTDLRAGIIRAVGVPAERFHEDALRMMRTVRFASQLAFEIEPQTLAAIDQNAELLLKIAVERIHEEWQKLLLGQDVQLGLAPFIQTGLFRYCPQMRDYQVPLQRMLTLPKLNFKTAAAAWGLFAYLANFSPSKLGNFLKSWKSSNQLIEETKKILQVLLLLTQRDLKPSELYQFGWPIIQQAGEAANLLGINLDLIQLQQIYQQLPIKSTKELVINGGILLKNSNLKPGPKLGKILKQLEIEVVEKKVPNQLDSLLARAKQLI